jgi:hypothetical protein
MDGGGQADGGEGRKLGGRPSRTEAEVKLSARRLAYNHTANDEPAAFSKRHEGCKEQVQPVRSK